MEKMLTIRDKGSTYLILISPNGDIPSVNLGNLDARYILAERKKGYNKEICARTMRGNLISISIVSLLLFFDCE